MWSIWPNMNGDCLNQMEFLRLGQMLGNRRTFYVFNPEACRTYWKQCREELFPGGVDAWWCDCSEPFEADWYGEVEMLPEDRMYFNVDEFKRHRSYSDTFIFDKPFAWHVQGPARRDR